MNASDLKNLFNAGRPLVEQWLDLTEQFSALRAAAAEKEIEWSQVKALLKAQIQDERDGTGEGKRVKALLERADTATAYGDLLGLSEKINYFSETPQAPSRIEHPAGADFIPPVFSTVFPASNTIPVTATDDGLEIPVMLRRIQGPRA